MSHKIFRLRALVIGLAATFLLAGCISIEIDGETIGGSGIDGSGVLVIEDRATSDFNAIEVSHALRVELEHGPIGVEAEFDDNLIEKLETTVRDGELRIRCPNCSPSSAAVVRVTAPEIDSIEVSGASRVIASDIEAPDLRLSVSGASRIEIDGDVTSLEVDGSGAARIEGPELTAVNLDVDLSGASRLVVTVIETARGDLSGASRLALRGDENPTVDVDTSGGSSVED